MNENRHARRAPEPANGPATGVVRHAQRGTDTPDALEWRERDQERARLLLERAGDIARRIERACVHLIDEPARTAH